MLVVEKFCDWTPDSDDRMTVALSSLRAADRRNHPKKTYHKPTGPTAKNSRVPRITITEPNTCPVRAVVVAARLGLLLLPKGGPQHTVVVEGPRQVLG